MVDIECISADGRKLAPFFIFKGKRQMESWIQEVEEGGKVCISQKGWTSNRLGLEWFKQVFHPGTLRQQDQPQQRLLILDGHASHMTLEVIRFCISYKIILFCLPHTRPTSSNRLTFRYSALSQSHIKERSLIHSG